MKAEDKTGKRTNWVDEDSATMIKSLWNEGLTYNQIAKRLGYSYNQVWRVINYRKVQSYSPYGQGK